MDSNLKVGLASIDITPKGSCNLSGFPILQRDFEGSPDMGGYVGRMGKSIGVADPLLAKILVANSGSVWVAIVALDLTLIDIEFTRQVREKASKNTGIPAENILLAPSQTHSGVAMTALGMYPNEDAKAWDNTINGIAIGIEVAANQMKEATIGFGRGDFSDYTINRRDPDLDADGELLVIRLDIEEKPIGILYNVACHPLLLDYRNHHISADFPGYASPLVESAMGNGVLALYLQGAPGDVNPIRFPYQPKLNVYDEMSSNHPVFWGGFDDVKRFGQVLGAEVLRVAASIKTESCQGLAASTVPVSVPLKDYEGVKQHCHFAAYTNQQTEKMLADTSLHTEIQAIQLGNSVLIAIPGEPFAQIGIDIKRQVKGLEPIIVGDANDDIRYILTEDCYSVNRYETTGTPLAKESGEIIKAAALQAVARLTP